MQCVQCQHDNPEGAKFCNACASPVIPICPSCATENPAGAKFCHQCATNLETLLSATGSVQTRQQETQSESRLYSYLFAVIAVLQHERRVTYQRLNYLFGLGDALLEEIRRELAFKEMAIDKDGEGLVWIGETQLTSYPVMTTPRPLASADTATDTSPVPPSLPSRPTEAGTPSNGPTRPAEAISTETLQDESAIIPEPVRSAPEAERRQLTVMFCDLADCG